MLFTNTVTVNPIFSFSYKRQTMQESMVLLLNYCHDSPCDQREGKARGFVGRAEQRLSVRPGLGPHDSEAGRGRRDVIGRHPRTPFPRSFLPRGRGIQCKRVHLRVPLLLRERDGHHHQSGTRFPFPPTRPPQVLARSALLWLLHSQSRPVHACARGVGWDWHLIS